MKKKEFKPDGWSAWMDAYINNENYYANGEYVLSDEDKEPIFGSSTKKRVPENRNPIFRSSVKTDDPIRNTKIA